MTRVQVWPELAPGVRLTIDRETDSFAAIVGQWHIRMDKGDLVVSQYPHMFDGSEVLRVPAGEIEVPK